MSASWMLVCRVLTCSCMVCLDEHLLGMWSACLKGLVKKKIEQPFGELLCGSSA